MSSIRVLGVMTGTSCDALDAACLEFDLRGWRPTWRASERYPRELRARVLKLQAPGSKWALQQIMELNRDLGAWYGDTLRRLCSAQAEELRPDVIANHGQTVGHFPFPDRSSPTGITLQLGDPALVAHFTGRTVVSHFREGDLAARGQGAPLVPGFHRILANLLPEKEQGVAIHNIGGISNLTYVSPDDDIIAFDTGPGNAWIDAAAHEVTQGRQSMDRGGAIAAQGRVDEPAVKKILKHPYFSKTPPKSTGRDEFPYKLFRSHTRRRGADLVTTATAVTVESIARAYERQIFNKRLPLQAIYLCGGGAKNPALVSALKLRLRGVRVKPLSKAGWHEQWIEAQAFSYFGFLSLLGKSYSGEWTGVVRGFAPPGWITPGVNWKELISKVSLFAR